MRRSQKLRGRTAIVAGAGLAGLTAAYELSHRGASVQVFEARNRIGGRVWTWRDTPIAPHHAELGGELIESDHKAIRGVCRDLGLSLTRVLLRGFGLVLRQGGRTRVFPRQTTLWRQFSKAFESRTKLLESAEGQWHSAVAAALARESIQDVLDEARATSTVNGLAIALRNLYLAEPADVSALVAAEEVLGGGDPSHMVAYRIAGGNDGLADALVENGSFGIDREHTLRRIKQTDDGVRVTVETPRGRLTIRTADVAVVALPVPLLRDVEFDPALPEAQRLALDTISIGPATKALLRFGSAWWRQPGLPRAFGTTLPIGAVWDGGEDQRDAAILTLLAGASASDKLRRLLRRPTTRSVMSHLQWLNNGSAELPKVRAVSWERDPWARGGYEYFSPKFDPALQPLLSRGFGRVFFAGSYTSREYVGYMNGAVESGQRVCREIELLAS